MRLALLAFAVLAFAVGCGGSDDESSGTTTATTTATNGECASVDAPEPRDPGSNDAPTAPLEDGKTYALTFDPTAGRSP